MSTLNETMRFIKFLYKLFYFLAKVGFVSSFRALRIRPESANPNCLLCSSEFEFDSGDNDDQ